MLEFLLGRERSPECKSLIHEIVKGRIAVFISRTALYSIELVMSNQGKLRKLAFLLDMLRSSRSLTILNTDIRDDLRILEIMEKMNIPYDDALHYYLCKRYNLMIISFNKEFDETDLLRIEPHDIGL